MRVISIITATFIFCNTSAAQTNIGIGIATPRSLLHVYSGPSGNNSPFSPLVVEGAINTYINILTANGSESGLLFGKPADAAHGGIVYNNQYTLDGFQFRTNGNIARMILNNSGFLGIATLTPATKLDVFGGNWDLTNTEGDVRIGDGAYRLKFGIALGGGGIGAAGIMQYGQPGGFNNLALGSQGKNYIHINGNSDYVDFTNVNGGIRINGNAGQSTQVLYSKGTTGAPEWKSAANYLFNNSTEIGPSGAVDYAGNDYFTYPTVPGFSKVINITGPTKVIVDVGVHFTSLYCFTCGGSKAEMSVEFQTPGIGNSVHRYEKSIPNGDRETLQSGMLIYSLTVPGNYTFSVKAGKRNGPTVSIGGDHMSVIVLPQ